MLFEEIRDLLIRLTGLHGLIYLVGGSVRDAWFKKNSPDFDLVFEFDAISAGRTIADYFHGDFYVLDSKRGTGRALFHHNGKEYKADCALLNPLGIAEDLRNRDFTINAMAVQVPEFAVLIDPLGGFQDLKNHHLRLCNPKGFIQDPVRILRAVRFAIDLDLQMNDELLSLLRDATSLLTEVSSERLRDELINILNTKNVKNCVQRINDLGFLDHVFPGLNGLFLINQAPPHVHDGWNHTLKVTEYCQIMIDAVLAGQINSLNRIIQEAIGVLKRYEMELREILAQQINPLRNIRALFFIGALYHDTGKPLMTPVTNDGKTSFPGHEFIGEKIARDFCFRMAFSNKECDYIRHLVAGHMLPISIKIEEENEFRRSAYRFYKQTGGAGVFVCIMHLADILSTYENTLSPQRWQIALDTTDRLLDIWFHQYEEVVDPPKLIDGTELQENFGIAPSPQLGDLLECIREEQAAGEIVDIQQARQFIRRVINGLD